MATISKMSLEDDADSKCSINKKLHFPYDISFLDTLMAAVEYQKMINDIVNEKKHLNKCMDDYNKNND